ncbi:MAG: universal stress protein [Candidatus Limnocylindrales bacterium]
MNKILVAYDGGKAASKALETAATLAHAFGASVSVVSVVPVHGIGLGVEPWDDADVHARELTEAQTVLRARGIEAQLLEPVGAPAQTILRIAEEGEFDTIVIGSRGLNILERILQGSVSEHVATHAAATVIVAR